MKIKKLNLLLLVVFSGLSFTFLSGQVTWYVNDNAPGGNGTSWGTAFNDLQAAIAASNIGDQIWIKEGVYKPTNTNDRSVSFSFKARVEVFGGFPESGNPSMADRNPSIFETILSGNIGDDTVNSDNSYHVVYMSGLFFYEKNTTFLNTSLDGLVIQDGNANGDTEVQWHWNSGAGLFLEVTEDIGGGIHPSGMRVNNCVFRNNEAVYGGGGMYIRSSFGKKSTFTFANCTFDNNKTPNGWGGGVLNNAYNGTNQCIYSNCVFKNNQASQGAAMALDGRMNGNCSPNIVNCLFENNIASNSGGALRGATQDNGTVGWNICNTTFENNKAEGYAGGAIATWGNGTDNGGIIDSKFTNNSSITPNGGRGGAIFFDVRNNQTLNTQIKGCSFEGNNCNWAGGAVSYLLSGATNTSVIKDCYFSRNEALYGGALEFSDGEAAALFSIENCHFNASRAIRNSEPRGGAGGAINSNSKLAFNQCVFTNNIADYDGGAITFWGKNNTSTCENSKFINNEAKVSGGAIRNYAGQDNTTTVGDNSRTQFIQCVFQGNKAVFDGGAFWNTAYDNGQCMPTILNSTFYNNNAPNGKSIQNTKTNLTVTNSILWGDAIQIADDNNSTTSAANCNIQQNGFAGVNGNISSDPLFTNPTNYDLTLMEMSPCIDRGDNTKVPMDLMTDIVGNDRFLDGDNLNASEVDMGAYERDITTQNFNLTASVEGVTCEGQRDGSIRLFWAQNNINFDYCDTVFFTITGVVENISIHPTLTSTKPTINTVYTYTTSNFGTFPFRASSYYLAEGFYTITMRDCDNIIAETTVYIPVSDHDGDNIADCNDLTDCDLPTAVTVTKVDPTGCNTLTGSLTFNVTGFNGNPNDLSYSKDGSFFQSSKVFNLSTGNLNRFFVKNNTTQCVFAVDTTIIVALTNCVFEGYLNGTPCNDGVDNDGNGLTDCEDNGCSAEIGHFSNVQPPSCANGNDGSIRFQTFSQYLKVSIDGGDTYLIPEVGNNQGIFYTLKNLPAGTYIFKTYNEKSGCSASESITFSCINNPPGCTDSEFLALKDLFTATDGGNWVTSSNWDTSRVICYPCSANWEGVTCSYIPNLSQYKLTKLDLSGHNLNGTLPISLVNLTQLDTLDLSNNNLQGCIPDEYRTFCDNGVFVNLSNNPNLENDDFATFCSSNIGNCNNNSNNSCPSTITLNGTPTQDSTYTASATITSTDTLNSPLNITYKAGQSISLLPGFEVKAGATFLATIEDCNSTFQEPIEEVLESFLLTEPTSTELQAKMALKVFPNPFSYTSTIQFDLATATPISIHLYDLNGRQIKAIVLNVNYEAGSHQLTLESGDLQAGIYYVNLISEAEQLVKKVMVLD